MANRTSSFESPTEQVNLVAPCSLYLQSLGNPDSGANDVKNLGLDKNVKYQAYTCCNPSNQCGWCLQDHDIQLESNVNSEIQHDPASCCLMITF